MTSGSWTIFVLSQLPIAFCIVFGCMFISAGVGVDASEFFFFWIPSVGLLLLDLFMITGVIGHGWPVPIIANAALLMLGTAITISAFFLFNLTLGYSFLVLLLGIALFVFLLRSTHWPTPTQQATIKIPAARPSSSATSQPQVTTSGPDWPLIWTAVGGIGALIGGCAALVSALRRR